MYVALYQPFSELRMVTVAPLYSEPMIEHEVFGWERKLTEVSHTILPVRDVDELLDEDWFELLDEPEPEPAKLT